MKNIYFIRLHTIVRMIVGVGRLRVFVVTIDLFVGRSHSNC